uniref:Protein krueppel n=1 Tax=Anopheles farauti TaxID=69004 RepID=A0A182QYT2_9DIPT
MDEEKPTVCRICISVCNGKDSCNIEAIAPDRTFSLHFMLETLFPTVFNLEQILRDVAMNWPTNICLNCKGKVMVAYGLYESCMQSYGRLQKYFEQTQPNVVIFEEEEGAQLDAPMMMEEESLGIERDENEISLKQSTIDDSVQPEGNEITTSSPKLRKRRPKAAAAADHITVIEELDVLCDAKNSLSTPTKSPAKKRGRRKTVPDVTGKSKPAGHETAELQQKNVEELETMKDLYRCLLCDAPTYTSPKELTEHLKAVHPDQIHHCEQCPKVFMSAQTFQHHQYCHATGRSFFCTFCDKGFQTEQLVKNHIRTHTHRSEYLCYLCGKEFNNRSNLRQHVKGHSGDRPWACTLCPSRFTTKGERPFGCEVCNMRFSTNYMVKRHMRTHTGEKPFKCTYCERSFTQSNDMVKHMRTHLGKNPYKCDRCDASFRLLTDLRNHYKDHYQAGELQASATGLADNTKPTFCRICAMLSSTEYSIYAKVHNDGTMSMHTMLQKLVPSVFNAEQMKMDEFMSWPRKVCETCKGKVLEAYALYESCLQSGDLMRECMSKKGTILGHDEERSLVALDEDYPAEESYEVSVPYDENEEEEPGVREKQEVEEEKKSPSTPPSPKKPTRARSTRKTKLKQEPTEDSLLGKVKTINEKNHHSPASNDDCQEANSQDEAPKPDPPTQTQRTKKQEKLMPKRRKRTPTTASNKSHKEHDQSAEEELETKIDLYRCLLCDSPTYSAPKELTAHLKSMHSDQIHNCKQCPKVFMTQAAFEHHQYCHATGRSFFCTFCDKGFQTEQLLANHVRTHTHRTGFLCSQCGQEFSNRSNLRQHMMRHTGDKPWVCNLCPSRFSMKSYLDRHQHTHTKAKYFSCDTCGSAFSRHYSLVKHKLIHTGDRHFACEVCSMRFTSSHHVKRHMLTHTGEKPFKCTYCERSFTQSNDMVKHMRTHVGKNPYKCDRCDASFRLLTDLRNHYREHCQSDNSKPLAVADEDKTIRFTSANILKLRYEKEMGQYSDAKYESVDEAEQYQGEV